MADQNSELACQKIFGWPNEKENGKPKYSWITKTNSDGTPNFPLDFVLCLGHDDNDDIDIYKGARGAWFFRLSLQNDEDNIFTF